MNRKLARPIGLLSLALFLSLGAGCIPTDSEPTPVATDADFAFVAIRNQQVAVEIVSTPKEQALGLGERDSLAWDRGMYFTYEQPGFYAFWMKGMRFSIDIVWIRSGRIVQIDSNVAFERGGNGPTVRPRSLVDAVLEVPAGYSTAKGWKIGDRVALGQR